MKKTLLSLAIATLLTGCATGSLIKEQIKGERFDAPVVEQSKFFQKEENKLAPPAGGPIPVAVYNFRDQTGQRKSVPLIASLSSAVTQGADNYLIKALQDVGDQRWFIPLERVGLENLIKERQMIRQMREMYQGKDAKPLPPMMFAGIIMEGGIVGYDSNTMTGGSGMRVFGIGATTQYQSDTVTVTLRTVSVSTGEVLTTTTVTKTVLSYMDKLGVLKFYSSGEQAFEAETGMSVNESINRATNLAIQAAVVNTIREGARKGHWSFKEEKPVVQPQANQTIPTPKVEQSSNSAATQTNAVDGSGAPITTGTTSETKENSSQGEVVDWSNVRKEQDLNSEKLVNLKPGTRVEILRAIGEYYFVKVDGKEGWVAKKFIKVQ